jgi:hypothetical protein
VSERRIGAQAAQALEPDTSTVTYFIQAGVGPVKIGRSTLLSLPSRLSSLQGGNAERLYVIGVVPGDVERELHERWAKHRIRGEWFRPDPEIVEYAHRFGAAQWRALAGLRSHRAREMRQQAETGPDVEPRGRALAGRRPSEP